MSDPLEKLLHDVGQASPLARQAAAGELARFPDPRTITALLGALRDADPGVRAAAAASLGELGDDRALPELEAALTDPSWYVRREAAGALGHFTHPQAIRSALRGLSDGNAQVREAALRSLAHQGPAAAPSLLPALRSPYPEVRAGAVQALGNSRLHQAWQHLQAALRDAHPEVRRTAARALGQLGDPRVGEDLVKVLDDIDPLVRASAATALGDLGFAPAAPRLSQCLRDFHLMVRRAAVNSLLRLSPKSGDFGCDQALEPLLEALNDADASVREGAALALAALEDTRALPALRQRLKVRRETDRVKSACQHAIGRISATVAHIPDTALSRAAPSPEPVATDRSLSRAKPPDGVME